MPNQKFAKNSVTIMTEMVLPNDTNTLNNLMGGRLMHWMDIVAAIAAQKHCNRIVVTASADNISFKQPINLGNVVTLRSQVTRAFNSSMEVFIEVTAEDIPASKKIMTHRAFFTFDVSIIHFLSSYGIWKIKFGGCISQGYLYSWCFCHIVFIYNYIENC